MREIDWSGEFSALQRRDTAIGIRLANTSSRHARHNLAKRTLDIVLSGILLVALLPLLALVAAAVKLDGGPIVFGHRRIGRDGKSFACLKFRSMVPNAGTALERLLAESPEAAREWAETRKLTDDPRVTRIGAFLRKTSFDELPQLVNVLRGEMSLVGPRPVVEQELVEHYGEAAATYARVRPGITGLWQISGRSDTSYAERVALDCRYVRDFSVWTDLRILASTVPAVLLRRGAY